MMKPYTWSPDQTIEEQKNGAYFERNLLALLLAVNMSQFAIPGTNIPAAGWYRHPNDLSIDLPPDYPYWESEAFSFYGWSRVISLYGGEVTFHVPDDFDLGSLPQVKATQNYLPTEEKWLAIMQMCGCEVPE